MSCKNYADQWDAYTLGLLSDEKTQAMKDHLETCTACQTELRQHQQARDVLTQAFEEGPSDQLVQRTLAHIRERQAKRTSWFRWGAPILVGATVALLLVVIRPGQIAKQATRSEQEIAPAMFALESDEQDMEKSELVMTASAPQKKAKRKQTMDAGESPVRASAVTEPSRQVLPASNGLGFQLKNPIADRSIYEDLGVATDVAKLLL